MPQEFFKTCKKNEKLDFCEMTKRCKNQNPSVFQNPAMISVFFSIFENNMGGGM